MQTPVITYNLRERGRRHRGKERNFNVRALAAYINGPVCQERIRNRDMLGYYGHWPRIKFGLNPAEGGLDCGKPSLVEPAIVTTMLKAHDDGTIEHQAEFLDTDSGKVAAKLYASRTGGFSSAIDNIRQEFWGFDYVFEPNYTTNRGYTLDDVRDMTLDDVEAAIYDEQLRGLHHLLDAVNAERNLANDIIERLRTENEQLLSMLASKGVSEAAALDSTGGVMPIVLSGSISERMERDAAAFHGATLPHFVEPKPDNELPANSLYGRLIGKFTR